MSAVPADSVAVILLRPAGALDYEVLLVERHAESRSFAGAHVFPGGRIDADDAGAAFHAASTDLSLAAAASRLGEGTPPMSPLAFWVAAIRELFEETGILLASIDGDPVRFDRGDLPARFRAHRAALLSGTSTFAEVVRRERLTLAAQELDFFSRWITPVNAPRRYDARFFVARLPAGQSALADGRETTSASWLTPAAALTRARSGTLMLTPPTMRTLEDLDALGSCDAIVGAARQRRFATILPKVVTVTGQATILYPGDALYERAVAGAALDDASGPRNRVVMVEGAWRSVRSPDA
jgi:8-oxo-dGTP pyrophosphatase MutT (NUDIX family)